MPAFAEMLYEETDIVTSAKQKKVNSDFNKDRYIDFTPSKKAIHINMKYDPFLIEQVKKLDSPRYSAKTKEWACALSLDNINALASVGFSVKAELRTWYNKWDYHNITEMSISGVKLHTLTGQLREFQKKGVAYILARNGSGIIADEMGVGKTVQAIGLCAHMNTHRPALVVCPASLKYNWAKEIKKWMPQSTIYIVSGRPSKTNNKINNIDFMYHKGTDSNDCIFIINYDIIANNVKKEVDKRTKKPKIVELPGTGWITKLIAYKFKIIIFDEAQYLVNKKAQRTKACLKLAKKIDNKIVLSGTPITNRPVEFYNVLNMVHPYLFTNFMKFAQRYCDAKHDGYGWNFKGASNTKELHSIVSKACVIRRRKKDVLKELPPKNKAIIPIQITNTREYKKAASDLSEWLKEKGNYTQAETAKKHEALMRIEALKQLAVKGKLQQCITWIHDFIANGEKLVVFATHTDVINTIVKEFGLINTKKGICVKVTGEDSPESRQNSVDAFQNNDNCRLFVGNIKAAGVGLTLTAAANTCFLELEWSPGLMDQAEDRVHRIGQKYNVTAWYLLARHTIEEDIAELLDEKSAILSAVLDGEDV